MSEDSASRFINHLGELYWHVDLVSKLHARIAEQQAEIDRLYHPADIRTALERITACEPAAQCWPELLIELAKSKAALEDET
jgi:hypothetical protein